MSMFCNAAPALLTMLRDIFSIKYNKCFPGFINISYRNKSKGANYKKQMKIIHIHPIPIPNKSNQIPNISVLLFVAKVNFEEPESNVQYPRTDSH